MKSNYFLERNGSQITGKRILVQSALVYFLKGQEPFHHLQMKQEKIKLLSSEAHLASAEHKPDPPQKLCSGCCVFMLNLQGLVSWQGWGLRQGLSKTQLRASGSWWASWSLLSLSSHRVRLSKSPVSSCSDSCSQLSDRLPVCYRGLRQFLGVLSLLVCGGRPLPGIALSPCKNNYWLE